METHVISNGAMNYDNALQSFKISKLVMSVKDDFIHAEIHSPLLTATNYKLKVLKNKLRLQIKVAPTHGNAIPIPLSCDLFLPKQGYNTIVGESFKDGHIQLKIAKNSKAKQSLYNQNIA